MITTVDNFHLENHIFQKEKEIKIDDDYFFKYTSRLKDIKNLNLTLEDFKKSVDNKFILFEDKNSKNDLIISITVYKDSNGIERCNIQTGPYIGKFKYNGTDINIQTRFPSVFMERMLNIANDVYIDDKLIFEANEKKSKEFNYSRFIIYHLFIRKLEKAFLLNIPKMYRSVNNHGCKLKGKIDIPNFIKKDIPFKGKISSISREQKESQIVIDVLYKALSIVEKQSKEITVGVRNLTNIKYYLKQNKSNRFISKFTVEKAMNSKALLNPIYYPYKKALKYAKLIIESDSLEEDKGNKHTFGFLVNISRLFEIYIFKLLKSKFEDWKVKHEPEISLYKGKFYERKIKPDIVLENGEKVAVFDVKYKKMLLRGTNEGIWDLDREDFFQIHTYMCYYKNKGKNVVAGGLLYPIEKKLDKYNKYRCHSDNWFDGENSTKFIVDGIEVCDDVSEKDKGLRRNNSPKKIIEREKVFLNRIEEILKD